MSKTKCGIDCTECVFLGKCKGCIETNGKPFDGKCVVAECINMNKMTYCSECKNEICKLKEQVIDEINNLHIQDLEPITSLTQLLGSYINLEYKDDNGNALKLLENNKIYLGTQVQKNNSSQFFGITADEDMILISEYSSNGQNPKLVYFGRRK